MQQKVFNTDSGVNTLLEIVIKTGYVSWLSKFFIYSVSTFIIK